jgi:hypothetical protein
VLETEPRNGVSFKVKIMKKLREDNEANHHAEIRKRSYQGDAFQVEVMDREMARTAAKSGGSYKAQKAKIRSGSRIAPYCATSIVRKF